MKNLIAKAIEQAKKSECLHKHGAVVFEGHSILSSGYNKNYFTPEVRKYGYKWCSLHAEADAILKSDHRKFRNKSLLIIRWGLTKLKHSKPCPGCLALIKDHGIKTIYYSDISGGLTKMKV